MTGNKFIKVVPSVKPTNQAQRKPLKVPQGTTLIQFDPYLPWDQLTPEMRTCAIAHFITLSERKKKQPHVIRFVRPERART